MTVLALATVLGIPAGIEGDPADGAVDSLPREVVSVEDLDGVGDFSLTDGAEEVPVALEERAALVAVEDPVLERGEEELPAQLRSYNGVLLKVVPTTPKLGLGVFG